MYCSQYYTQHYGGMKIQAYNHEMVPLGSNGAKISDVSLEILTERQLFVNYTENSYL